MRRYYESESFKSFKIKYDVSTWYQFKNPALIFPMEREMLFSTPNQHIKSDYCYADMADALRLLYEKERTACRSYIQTLYIVQGLCGAADKDDDGRISVRELCDYSFPKICEYSLQLLQDRSILLFEPFAHSSLNLFTHIDMILDVFER